MSKTDQFNQYAEEAMRWASHAKTEQEKQAYIDLACTWTRASLQSKHIFGDADDPAKDQMSSEARPTDVEQSRPNG